MDNRNLPPPVERCFSPPSNAGSERKKSMHSQLWKEPGRSDRKGDDFDEHPYLGDRTTSPPYLAVCTARVWDGNLCDRAVCPHRGVFIHRLTRVIHISGFSILFGQPQVWCVVNGPGREDGMGSPGRTHLRRGNLLTHLRRACYHPEKKPAGLVCGFWCSKA